MLSVMYGLSVMIQITFGVAGYAVSRDPGVTLQRSIAPKLTTTRAKDVGTLIDRI
ncbi:MAG TPA: hypothetical protein VME67_26290 [Mycobacterium sp.]|nr:hypothetical protein [Mycobacterium sp.]HTX98028.1 hypothetical protein [Mycobacterium sp.]